MKMFSAPFRPGTARPGTQVANIQVASTLLLRPRKFGASVERGEVKHQQANVPCKSHTSFDRVRWNQLNVCDGRNRTLYDGTNSEQCTGAPNA